MGMKCSKQGENFPIDEVYNERKNKRFRSKVNTPEQSYEEDSQELLVFRDFVFTPSKSKDRYQNTVTEESAFSKETNVSNNGLDMQVNANYAKEMIDSPVKIVHSESIKQSDTLQGKEKEDAMTEYVSTGIKGEMSPVPPNKSSLISQYLPQTKTIKEHPCISPENDKLNKLYNSQGKQHITSQDLNQLMTSICSTVGQSLSKDNSESSGNYLKICLEIGNDNSRSDAKVPNKYTPTKQYNGFTFPPPNSEEAEKVNDYINKKLSFHESKYSSKGVNRNGPRGRHCSKCHHNMKPSSALSLGSRDKENRYIIPRRRDYCDGEERLCPRDSYQQTCNCRRDNPEYRSCRSAGRMNYESPSAFSRSRTPEYWSERAKCNTSKCNDSSSRIRNGGSVRSELKTSEKPFKIHNERNYKMRLPHLCSLNKVKGRLKPTKSNRKFDEKTDIRKNLKLPAGKHFYDDAHRFFHDSSIPSWSNPHHFVDCNCKISNNIDLMGWNRPYDQKRCCTTKHSPKINNLSNISLKFRPEVWPGECSESDYHHSLMELKPPCHVNIPMNSDELCYCGRILGMDKPRHAKTVYHSHKHEYYHYHYYITQASH